MTHIASRYRQVFKNITGDNGPESAELSLLDDMEPKESFTHPYSPCEKGTNECRNRILRRILGYESPRKLLKLQPDRISRRELQLPACPLEIGLLNLQLRFAKTKLWVLRL